MHSKWYKINDRSNSNGFTIKRYAKVKGKTKWESLPVKQYKHLPKAEVEALLRRLNATYEIKAREATERYNFNHAYVNTKSIRMFEEYLSTQANDKNHITSTMSQLTEYAIDYFVLQQKLPDPNEWHRKETEWGLWLQVQDLRASTIKKIVGTTNRFMEYLVDRVYPEMTNPRRLEPIGKQKLKKLSLSQKNNKSKYITAEKFEEICKKFSSLAPDLLPNIKLCYYFGLRINETLGLTKDKFFKSYLKIDEQGDKYTGGILTLRELKTLDKRKVPYWFISGKEAWLLVKTIKPMSPDSLNRKANTVLRKSGHKSHDFRRTFITNALRQYHWKDVQVAVGHKDVRTTMQYNQDDREMNDEKLDLD